MMVICSYASVKSVFWEWFLTGDLQQGKGFGAQAESNRMKRVSSSKKLTGSRNYLFPRFYFILADEHFFMMAILALKLKTILVNFPFFPGHNSC